MKTKRLVWIDQLRGLAMLAVVFGHMPLSKTSITYLYSFHLPLFFMISGMTYYFQSSRLLESKTIISYTMDKAKKLLIPYFLFNIALFPLWVYNFKILGNSDYPLKYVVKGIFYSNEEVYSSPTNATWFLIVLFLVSISFFTIQKLCIQKNIWIIIIFCSLYGYADSLTKQTFNVPWHIQTVFTGIGFYFLGFKLMEHMDIIEELYAKYKVNIIFKTIIVLILMYTAYYFSQLNTKVSMHKNEYNSVILFYTSALLTSFCMIYVAKHLPAFKIDILKFIGQNTLTYMALHCPMLRFLQHYSDETIEFTKIHPVYVGIAISLLLIPISILVNRLFPFLIGRYYRKKQLKGI